MTTRQSAIVDAVFAVADMFTSSGATAVRKVVGAALARSAGGRLEHAVDASQQELLEQLIKEFRDFQRQWEEASKGTEQLLEPEDAALYEYLYYLMLEREREAGDGLVAHDHIGFKDDIKGCLPLPEVVLEESLNALKELGYVNIHRSNMGIHTVVMTMAGVYEYAEIADKNFNLTVAQVLIAALDSISSRYEASSRSLAKRLEVSHLQVLSIFQHFSNDNGLNLIEMTGGVTLATCPAVWLKRKVRRLRLELEKNSHLD